MDVKFLALLVFITRFAGGQGYEVKWQRDLTVHKFKVQDDQRNGCKQLFTEFIQNRKDAKCQPRKTLIPISTGDPNYMYEPTHLAVNRCSGTCEDKKSCIGNEKKISKFSVHKIPITDGISECGFIEVEEDINCECSCTMKEENCNDQQMYDPDYCMCECKEDKDMTEECEKSGRLWDPARCRCNCKEVLECDSMQYFNTLKCKCMNQHDI